MPDRSEKPDIRRTARVRIRRVAIARRK